MQAEFWKAFGKRNNSTKQPSGSGITKTIRLKEDCSLLHPVFILETDDTYNYCYFRGRYFFVDDVISLANHLTEYHCSIDVLATWKSFIATDYQYVTRAGSSSDPTIIDSYYPAKSSASFSTQPLTTLHNAIVGSGFYVLGIIGKVADSDVDQVSGSVNYYAMNIAQLTALLDYMFDITNYHISAGEISQDLQKALINPFQYIVSAYWFPGNCPTTNNPVRVQFGWWECTDNDAACVLLDASTRMENHSMAITVSSYQHPKAISLGLKYLNMMPYSRMMIHCYMFGSIPLDPISFFDLGTGNVIIKIDRFSGIGELILQNGSSATIYKASAQMGVPVQLAQLSQNLVSAAISGVEGVISVAQGKIASGAAGIASAIESAMPQLSTSGSNGSIVAYQTVPSITYTHYDIANIDKSHFGAPLCQNVMLGTLAGYIMCEDPDADIPGTKAERDQVNDYLAGGFFYE